MKERVIELEKFLKEQEINHNEELNFLRKTVSEYEKKEEELREEICDLEIKISNKAKKSEQILLRNEKEMKD